MQNFLKILLSLISLLVFSNLVNGQVNDIKKESKKNSEKTTTESNNNSNNNSSATDNGGCLNDLFSGCISTCFSSAFEALIIGSIELQKEYISEKTKIQTVISLEFIPSYAYCFKGSNLIMPRIRGNWGLFSTDFRYYNILESTANNGIENYKTYDWQILELNPLITKNVKFRIGSGFMFEDFSKTYFPEHFIGLDLLFDKDKYLANLEFRIAKDYNKGSTPRTEGNIRMNYRILKLDNLSGYATLGGLYQNYYSSIDLWCIQAGMAFNFH